MSDIACKHCRFHIEQSVHGALTPQHLCLRYPPQVNVFVQRVQTSPLAGAPLVDQVQMNASLPVVAPHSWCGEFQPQKLLQT